MEQQQPKEKEFDVFKDSTLRFAGYANEVGEAFRPIIPKPLVLGTYAIAFLYGSADAGHKGTTTYQKCIESDVPKHHSFKYAINETIYTGIWQMLASVLIPPFFVNRAVFTASYFIKSTSMSEASKRWFPIYAGLASIPLIFYPIDRGVDYLLHHVYRERISKLILPDVEEQLICEQI